jgi:hypothetical protein
LDRLVLLSAIVQLFNKLHIHGIQVVVDFRVVNQLVGNMDLAVGEMIDRLVGESDAPFDAPTKAKVLEYIFELWARENEGKGMGCEKWNPKKIEKDTETEIGAN